MFEKVVADVQSRVDLFGRNGRLLLRLLHGWLLVDHVIYRDKGGLYSLLLHLVVVRLFSRSAFENGHSSPLKAMGQLAGAGSDRIGSGSDVSQGLLDELTCGHLFLFVLPDGERWNQILTSSTVDEEVVFLGDLHAHLSLRIVELAHATAFAESRQGELRRVGLRKVDDIQPGHLRKV